MSKKERNISGLTGVELTQAMTSIQALLDKVETDKKVGTSDEVGLYVTMDDDHVIALQEIQNRLQECAGTPQNLSFSSMTTARLETFGIEQEVSKLLLKSNHAAVSTEMDKLGENVHWSANGLFEHLQLLERIVPRTNEAAARLWINAFFYRVSSILSAKGQSMVLRVEQVVPAVTRRDTNVNVVSGTVDWTTITTSNEDIAAAFMRAPHLSTLKKKNTPTLFVTEAKTWAVPLAAHTLQAVTEMAACARSTGKNVIRGALTNGHTWIFLIVKLDETEGINYFESGPLLIIEVDRDDFESKISRLGVSKITAILVHWMMHSHEDLRDNDHFTIRRES